MPSAISDHDQRQYARMHEAIITVSSGALTLDALYSVISTLEFLLQALETKDAEWENKFYQKWGVLDEVYAVASDEGLRDVPAENAELVAKAIADIQGLLPTEA